MKVRSCLPDLHRNQGDVALCAEIGSLRHTFSRHSQIADSSRPKLPVADHADVLLPGQSPFSHHQEMHVTSYADKPSKSQVYLTGINALLSWIINL
jgi:hypothetical protein